MTRLRIAGAGIGQFGLMAIFSGTLILLGAPLSLPQGAMAQSPDLNAENCLSRSMGPGSITYTNTCGYTVKFKFCVQNASGQGCGSSGQFIDAIIGSGASRNVGAGGGGSVRWFACKAGADFWERPYDPVFDTERRVSFYCVPDAASVAAEQAATEEYGPLQSEVWTVRQVTALTPSGKRSCKMAMNHGAFGLDAAGVNFTKTRYPGPGPFDFYWRGACDPSGWIDGPGKLVLDSLDDYEGELARHTYSGRAARGRLTGPISYSRSYGYCDLNGCDPFKPAIDEEIGARIELTFADGCNNWKRRAPSRCVAARGLALVGPAPTAPPTKPTVGTPASIPSVASTTPQPRRAHPAAELARPTVSINGLFATVGYPELAKARLEQGQTNYSLTVNGAGLPTRCDITRSSGSAALDEQTCRVVMRGARFAPDPAGPSAILRRYDGGVSWKLP